MVKKDREMARRRAAARVQRENKRAEKRVSKARRKAQDDGVINLMPRVKMNVRTKAFAESVFTDLEKR